MFGVKKERPTASLKQPEWVLAASMRETKLQHKDKNGNQASIKGAAWCWDWEFGIDDFGVRV